jgi:iron-sulfur cluster assembly protein
MLTLTDNAVTAIRTLTGEQALADAGGLRISNGAEGTLTLSLANQPSQGDEVVENAGARLFVAPEAAQMLDGMALDAAMEPDGSVHFALSDSSG